MQSKLQQTMWPQWVTTDMFGDGLQSHTHSRDNQMSWRKTGLQLPWYSQPKHPLALGRFSLTYWSGDTEFGCRSRLYVSQRTSLYCRYQSIFLSSSTNTIDNLHFESICVYVVMHIHTQTQWRQIKAGIQALHQSCTLSGCVWTASLRCGSFLCGNLHCVHPSLCVFVLMFAMVG